MAYPLFHPLDPREVPLFMDPGQFRLEFPMETEFIERKQGASSSAIQETVVALSNAHGGVVLVGVKDDGEIAGAPLTQRLSERLHEAIGAVRNPGRYALHALRVGELEITVLSVERRVEGFAQTSNGRVLVRVGPRNVAIFDNDLVRFIQERSFQRFELSDAGVSFARADEQLVDRIARAFGWNDPDQFQEGAMSRGLVNAQGNLTVAGALFLLPRPSELLGRALVEYFRYTEDESTEYERRVTIEGPVPEQIESAARLLEEELGSELVVIGLERHELPKLPLVVIREAIANAVGHRSYEATGSPVRIELRPSAARVLSPGPLPAPVTVENIREAQAARNLAVIDVLRRLRLAEDAGRGIDVMQDTMRAEMLDPPAFVDTGQSVEVTLPIRGPVTPRERAWVLELERRGGIDPADRLLLVHAARGELLTNAKARKLARMDRVEATRALGRLRDAGFLLQQGERGGAVYTLDGSLNPPAGLRLTRTELKAVVLDMLEDCDAISNADVRARTGLDRVGALKLLEELVQDDKLRRVGQRRGSRYIAVEQG
jgi:ATP-dependent DNA helicase RecG